MMTTGRHRIIRTLALLLMPMLAAVGCAQNSPTADQPSADDPRPVVLTTFTVLQDIAQNVAGEHLRVESITRLGAEITVTNQPRMICAAHRKPTSSSITD